MTLRASFCLLVLLASSACGGSSTTATPAPALDGVWQGTLFSPTDAGGPITLQIVQAGTDITGTVRLDQNGTETPATLTGTVTSTSPAIAFRYTVAYQYTDGCRGSFSGTAAVTGATMDGQHDGQNCIRAFSGTLQATRTN
jgi:hypothetical protein